MEYWQAVAFGVDFDADGRPLVVVGGRALGTVEWIKERLEEYEQRVSQPKPSQRASGASNAA